MSHSPTTIESRLDGASAVALAARSRFGEVLAVVLKEACGHANFYTVACKRNEPARAEAPYMTITAKFPIIESEGKEVSFFWGHYDLTLEAFNREGIALGKRAGE